MLLSPGNQSMQAGLRWRAVHILRVSRSIFASGNHVTELQQITESGAWQLKSRCASLAYLA